MQNPSVVYDKDVEEVWLRFSVLRQELNIRRLSGPMLVAQMKTTQSTYAEVKSKEANTRTYESATARKLGPNGEFWLPLEKEFLGLNIFAHFGSEKEMRYAFPLQNSLPFRLPQLLVNYTILFWLGSLVRYDPHSVYDLMDSAYWILIDGFMTQSRIWLLELFEWALYQQETTLRLAR